MSGSHVPGSAPSTLSPGTTFGSYEILERLGAGGMGEVYRARDARLGREVAIKTVSLGSGSQPGALARLEQEARSACALNHPNIVTIYELGQVNGTQYIAMELIRGETVRELVASGPIPFLKAVAIATQIADALARAHENGIIHRDLKPENLMITCDGTAKILDFGLAKLRVPGQAVDGPTLITPATHPGAVMGTVGYMSPEQASGGVVDFRSDQFSFGCVLYEMVSGRPAFRGKSYAEIMAAILRDQPEPLAAGKVQAPAPLFWILDRCLTKDPELRYASTRDLAGDLATLRQRFVEAPLGAAESRPSNLPIQRTACIGREYEAAALAELLMRDDVRLVTLTGPGGIGKTRLALQVAGELAERFTGGVAFVSLSAIADPDTLPLAIVQAAGVHESGTQSPQELLRQYVSGLTDPMLLLLDNFEHLVSGAPLVAELLSVSPKLKLVVTSRAPLHVYGEHEFPVPPLALPDPKSHPPLDLLSTFPAIALFAERAKAVKHDFALTRENAAAVAAICARLDGLPLAIELAAARIKLLSPTAMLARLESSLNLLTGGARDLPLRQQTLRGTVDWSYRLLNPAEQTLFRRLAVFVGGCTLEAVEAVCDTRGDLGVDVLDGMASMVDKSLVQQLESVEAEARFLMLSTIREYALERLAESGEAAATRRAHAAYCLVLAEEGSEELTAHPEWLSRFAAEHDNFRSTLEFLIKTGDADWSLRLGAALFRFWEMTEQLAEGRDFLGRILALPATAAFPKLRTRLVFEASVLAAAQGDFVCSQRLQAETLEGWKGLGDYRGVAVALNALGVTARDRGELSESTSLFEQCVATWRQYGRPADIARALSNLASVVKLQGDFARAVSLYDECLALFREAGDTAGVAWTLNYQGDLDRQTGDFAAARSRYEQSLTAFRQHGDSWGIASVLCDLASLSCDQAIYEPAQRMYRESILMFQDLGHKRGIARVLECLALHSALQSRPDQALRLAGAAAAVRQRLGAPLTPAEQAKLEKKLESARQTLSNADGLAAWMEGWGMSVDEAVQQALGSASHVRRTGTSG